MRHLWNDEASECFGHVELEIRLWNWNRAHREQKGMQSVTIAACVTVKRGRDRHYCVISDVKREIYHADDAKRKMRIYL